MKEKNIFYKTDSFNLHDYIVMATFFIPTVSAVHNYYFMTHQLSKTIGLPMWISKRRRKRLLLLHCWWCPVWRYNSSFSTDRLRSRSHRTKETSTIQTAQDLLEPDVFYSPYCWWRRIVRPRPRKANKTKMPKRQWQHHNDKRLNSCWKHNVHKWSRNL